MIFPKLELITQNQWPFAPPSARKDIIFQLKYDGEPIAYNTLTHKMVNRRGTDVTHRYPELEVVFYGSKEAVIIGEVVCGEGREKDFQALQKRLNLDDEFRIALLSQRMPVKFIVHDIVLIEGKPVELGYAQRLAMLKELLIPSEYLEFAKTFLSFEEAWQFAVDNGYEGIVAKAMDRSGKMWKIKNRDTVDCIVVGFTWGSGALEDTMGALVLAQYNKDGQLQYVGRVGTGFTVKQREEIAAALITVRKTDGEPDIFGNDEIRKICVVWLNREDVVVEVEYLGRSEGGILRQPSFKRWRFDKPPRECLMEPINLEKEER